MRTRKSLFSVRAGSTKVDSMKLIARIGLHVGVGDAHRVRKHRELIAPERRLGEHVGDDERFSSELTLLAALQRRRHRLGRQLGCERHLAGIDISLNR